MKKSIILLTLALGLSTSLVACSPKKDTSSVEKQVAESTFNEQVSNALGKETKKDNSDVKCDESATLIQFKGVDVNVLDWINDTSEKNFLDYLAENGQTFTVWKGLDETVKSQYSVKTEQEETSDVLHEYLRPPYVYVSDNKYSLQLRNTFGDTLILHNDTEDGHSEAFLRTGIYDDATIGSKKYTIEDLSTDTENKLKSMFSEVTETSIGYTCSLGDFDTDGYRVQLDVQGKGDKAGGISYLEYTAYFKNMVNELDAAIK